MSASPELVADAVRYLNHLITARETDIEARVRRLMQKVGLSNSAYLMARENFNHRPITLKRLFGRDVAQAPTKKSIEDAIVSIELEIEAKICAEYRKAIASALQGDLLPASKILGVLLESLKDEDLIAQYFLRDTIAELTQIVEQARASRNGTQIDDPTMLD